MNCIRGYSDFLKSLNEDDRLRSGLMVDTSVLVSATDDADTGNEKAAQFLEYVASEEVPIYCNVTVRSEFLQQHRKLIFAEVLYELSGVADRSRLPEDIAHQFAKWRKTAPNDESIRPKLKLNEKQIQQVKRSLLKVASDSGEDAWTTLCRDLVGNKLGSAWESAVDEIGLNFLSTRAPNLSSILPADPEWENAVKIMETVGIASSDAMILNMFFSSELRAVATSDFEFAHAVQFLKPDRICFVPDQYVTELRQCKRRDDRKNLGESANKAMQTNSGTFRRLAD